MNTIYTTALSTVNRLFGSDLLMRDNIPVSIHEWIYGIHGVELEGKVIPVLGHYIIKDSNLEADTLILDTVLVADVPTRVVILSKRFLTLDVQLVFDMLLSIYKYLLATDNHEIIRYSSLGKVETLAPYVLTLSTFTSIGLSFEYDWMFNNSCSDLGRYLHKRESFVKLMSESLKYDAHDLLNRGMIVALAKEIYFK